MTRPPGRRRHRHIPPAARRPSTGRPGPASWRRARYTRERLDDRAILRWWLAGGAYGWGDSDSDSDE